MLNFLLDIVPGEGEKASGYYFDNVGEPFIYAAIGFLVVFAGIAIIIAVIWLLGLLMKKTDNLAFLTKKKAKTEKNTAEERAEESSDDIPDEVKVAITAAVIAYCSEAEPRREFVVKRIKRISKGE